jgi:site-specific DNA recombinase
MGKFFFTLLAATAEMERGLISERTKAVLNHKRDQGYVYGPVPFGCRRDGDVLISHEGEERTIELMLKLRAQGWNYSRIARELNDLGCKTKNAGQFFPQTVKNVIQRMVAA